MEIMNPRDRFKALMSLKEVDRLPLMEWAGYWDEEGLDRSLKDAWEIRRYFGLDSYRQYWISPRSSDCKIPARHGGPIIVNMDEYLELKPFLYPPTAFDKDMIQSWAMEQQKNETVVWITLEGFFWFPRTLLGIENHLYAFYDQPELIHMMNHDLIEFNLRVMKEFCELCVPDFMTFAEDMSYNNGPMISKTEFNKFIRPYYGQIVPGLKELGITPFVDSDGDIVQLLPWLTEIGIEGVLPLERMAGVDIVAIRRQFPKVKLIGGFDKTTMHKGCEAMRAEFERLLPVMRQGGYVPSVDHQTPPDVSLNNYLLYVSLLKEYCIKSGH